MFTKDKGIWVHKKETLNIVTRRGAQASKQALRLTQLPNLATILLKHNHTDASAFLNNQVLSYIMTFPIKGMLKTTALFSLLIVVLLTLTIVTNDMVLATTSNTTQEILTSNMSAANQLNDLVGSGLELYNMSDYQESLGSLLI